MDEVTVSTAEEFGFAAKSIRKLKYMYICRNDRETRIIKKTSLSADEIMNVYEFKKYLFKNGFKYTDRYFLSKNGVPYFVDGENTYIMTDFANTSETSFAEGDNFLRIVKAAAAFHKAGRGFAEIKDVFPSDNITDMLEKGIKKLTTVRKTVRNKKKITDYDVMFLKSFDRVYENALNALNIAKNIDIDKSFTICHNSLKEETVSVSGNVFITGMDSLSKNSFIADLADITERYMRKHGDNCFGIEDVLKAYSDINKIDSSDEKLLYALLLFPKGYIKSSWVMYSKNRKWVPMGTIQKFTLMCSLQTENEKYIMPIKCI